MKKKIKIIVVLIVLILLVVLSIIGIKRILKYEKENDVNTIVNEKIKNKESFMLYISSKNYNECYECKTSDIAMKNFFKSDEYIYYDYLNNEEHIKKLIYKFYKNENITYPTLIEIRNGEMQSSIIYITSEEILKNYLEENNILNKKEDGELIDSKKFKEIKKEKETNYILIGEYNEELSKKREELKEKIDKFYVMDKNVVDSAETIIDIEEKFPNITYPALVKVKNNKFISFDNV